MNWIERLIAALYEANLVAGPQDAGDTRIKLGAEDIADILWLLQHMIQKQLGAKDIVDISRLLRQMIQDLGSRETEQSRQGESKPRDDSSSSQDGSGKKQGDHDIKKERRQVYPYSQRSGGLLGQVQGGMLLRVPAASALPKSLDIARALRPFMRRMPSRTSFVLDERATANRIAETQRSVWEPVLRPAPMRWLEVSLVVDDGASMEPWRQTIDELRLLLEHHGAFRDVRVWRLATDTSDYVRLYAGADRSTQQERSPKELIDPTGRRLILAVTDCVSPTWYSGKAQQVLDLWGHSNIVTLVQVFPQRLWPRTALCNADIVTVRATTLNGGNAGMLVRGEQEWYAAEGGDGETGIEVSLPMPIVTLEPTVIANWARMIVGAENTWTVGAVFYQNLPDMPNEASFAPTYTSSPRDLVRQFRDAASPMASRLLNLLCAAPVSFPVIRLIQQAMLPQANQVHVAELFLSGLLEEVSRDETTNDPDYVEYEFLPGVREVLRDTLPVPDEFQVIEAVSTFLGSRYGQLRDFYAIATMPSSVAADGLSIGGERRPFARIVASAWRHLGGAYGALADNLMQRVEDGQDITHPGTMLREPSEDGEEDLVSAQSDEQAPSKVSDHEKDEAILTPNPRTISLELLARDIFKPMPFLNLFAAAWIQFMINDWFGHGPNQKENPWEVPLRDDDPWPQHPMIVMRTPDPKDLPPTFFNVSTHWWDGSQIYGNDAATQATVRSHKDGKLNIGSDGLLPADPFSGVEITGVNGNWWIGLSVMHTLFTLEHNAICDRLRAEYPSWSDDDLFNHSRLINVALMAKIHTVEWTPAIINHPTLQVAMRGNWWGRATKQIYKLFGRVSSSEAISSVPYSLTEEFVSVYRMHPLLPDEFSFRSMENDAVLQERTLAEVADRHARELLQQMSMADVLYSFGTSHPGLITLHNYPNGLRHRMRPDGFIIDLATIEIIRDRERGVPRYNEFRKLVHCPPLASFEELTDNKEWVDQLRRIYDNDINKVDLMIGMYAETPPKGFGLSDTASRIFNLMTSRYLNSDRLFTTDYTSTVYTQTGLDWISQNTMATVLLRHFPALAASVRGVKNAFAPWPKAM